MTVYKTARPKGWMHSPKNTKISQVDERRPSPVSIMELLNWTPNDWRNVIGIDESPFQVSSERNSKKVIIWNMEFVIPLEKMNILVWVARTAYMSVRDADFLLLKSLQLSPTTRGAYPNESACGS